MYRNTANLRVKKKTSLPLRRNKYSRLNFKKPSDFQFFIDTFSNTNTLLGRFLLSVKWTSVCACSTDDFSDRNFSFLFHFLSISITGTFQDLFAEAAKIVSATLVNSRDAPDTDIAGYPAGRVYG